MHVERTFTVARPVDEVFAYLGDFTHTEEWDPGTRSTERTTGDGGLGTTYTNVSEFMGRQVELTYTTITYVEPTTLQFQGRNPSSTSMDSLTFSDLGDGRTSIHYRADFTFHGWVRYVAPVVMRGKLAPLADETVEQLTRALER